MRVDISEGSYTLARHDAELAALWCEQMIVEAERKLEILQLAFVTSITHPPKLYDYTAGNLFAKFHLSDSE